MSADAPLLLGPAGEYGLSASALEYYEEQDGFSLSFKEISKATFIAWAIRAKTIEITVDSTEVSHLDDPFHMFSTERFERFVDGWSRSSPPPWLNKSVGDIYFPSPGWKLEGETTPIAPLLNLPGFIHNDKFFAIEGYFGVVGTSESTYYVFGFPDFPNPDIVTSFDVTYTPTSVVAVSSWQYTYSSSAISRRDSTITATITSLYDP